MPAEDRKRRGPQRAIRPSMNKLPEPSYWAQGHRPIYSCLSVCLPVCLSAADPAVYASTSICLQ